MHKRAASNPISKLSLRIGHSLSSNVRYLHEVTCARAWTSQTIVSKSDTYSRLFAFA